MPKIHDVSLLISNQLSGWPGDTPYALRPALSQEAGDSVNVGGVRMSLHFGTHVDAPFHVARGAATVDQLALEPFFGPAHLLDVRGYERIRIEHLDEVDFAATARVLLRTGGWTTHARFPSSIPVIADDVPDYLAEQGVVLLGLDVPSVDPLESRTLPMHHALRKRGIAILESLDLREPAAGVYQLIALPLKIQHGDAAPVRAVLVEL